MPFVAPDVRDVDVWPGPALRGSISGLPVPRVIGVLKSARLLAFWAATKKRGSCLHPDWHNHALSEHSRNKNLPAGEKPTLIAAA
jgi:hypothetical protein